ncbi:kinase-like domain-containing protein [Chytriomyces sp. MP71]|nr:kinase-like domain-containing protein [Chytriomyces sp. MP71]
MLQTVSPGLRQFLASIPGLEGDIILPFKLLQSYFLHHPLGEGATGFVVAGTRNSDLAEVAVKFMFKDRVPMAQGGWKRDFELGCVVPMEVFVMRRLEHDNIVRFYEVFEDSVFVYIVMEALEGDPAASNASEDTTPALSRSDPLGFPTLRGPRSAAINVVGGKPGREPHAHFRRRAHSKDLFDYIEKKPRMAEGVARLIFKQIAEAVAYLHARGFVHRDIKDENVIIDDNMKVKLIDFGAARHIPKNRTDYFADFVGTLTYAPPECIASSETTVLEPHRGPEQDVWSLGVLLFVLLVSGGSLLACGWLIL